MPFALAPIAPLGGDRFIVSALGAVLVVLNAFPLLTCVLHCVLPIVPHSRLQHVISVKQQGMCRRKTEGVSPLVSRFVLLLAELVARRSTPSRSGVSLGGSKSCVEVPTDETGAL